MVVEEILAVYCVLCELYIMITVRIIYSEDRNVIMTVTRGASQMRGSEYFRDKQLFPGFRSMGVSRNPACLKFSMDRNRSSCQKTTWAADQMAA